MCLVFFLIILSGCTRHEIPWGGTIEEIDGVVHIKNPETPLISESLIEFVEELSIGEAEGAPEYMFQEIRSLAVDGSNNIYVADWKESHIKVFDFTGIFLRTIGRRGEGPGEIGRAYSIQFTRTDEVMVHDGRNRKVHYFSSDGAFQRAVPFGGLFPLSLYEVSTEYYFGLVIVNDPENRRWELMKLDTELKSMATIETIPAQSVGQPLVVFEPEIAYRILPDMSLVYGRTDRYEFRILDSEGRVQKNISRTFTPLPVTTEIKQRIREQIPDEKISFTKYNPVFLNFTTDDEGRIYVQTCESIATVMSYLDNRPQAAHTYDVFDPEGKFLLKFTAGFIPRIWKNGKLYTVEEDGQGFQVVKRYQVNWLLE